MTPRCILVVRLGAMGDIIHTLPAVCSLRNTWPEARILWAVEPKWAPLLENNPCIDHLEFADRRSPRRILTLRHNLRSEAIDLAIDFQGLLKSAVVIMFARAKQSVGLSSSAARESLASLFYEKRITPGSQHIVNRNLELSNAAGALAPRIAFPIPPFPIPQGRPEGLLSEGPFVLANPLAGWTSKQWPLEHYAVIAARLKSRGFQLVLNGAAAVDVPAAISHISGLPGLIHATRRAHAVIGVDSGPLHLAAALGKPGVAIFGPTDPARNGPYGGTITTLRDPSAITSYKRGTAIDPSMRAVTPDDVWDNLELLL